MASKEEQKQAKRAAILAKSTAGTRICPHCCTRQRFDIVEEIPDEIYYKAHELNVPLRTIDRKGLLDVDFSLVKFNTIVFHTHEGPCGLPCISTYQRPPIQFEDHPGRLCREVGCRSKISQKQLNFITGHHNGSTCPCNTPPVDAEPKGEV